MSHSQVGYDQATGVGSAISLPSTLTTSEVELFRVTDGKWLQKSQFTIYITVTLGGVASSTFYYYYSPDNGATWLPVSLYNTATGEMTQRAVLLDSGTYASAGVSMFVDNLPVGAATQFKITGKSATGTPSYTVRINARDN